MVRLLILTTGFFYFAFAYAQIPQAKLQNCVLKAARGADPSLRDEAKLGCIQEFNETISVERCAQIAGQMEYTATADEARKYCIFDLTANPTVQQCAKVAKSAEYGANGDEIRWQCVRLLAPTASHQDCLKLSKDMVLPYNKRRLIEMCDTNY